MLKEILIVDGYNIIYAWPELKEMIKEDIAAARHALIEILRNYQGYREGLVTVVFDAYQTASLQESVEHYGAVSVIFTKADESADQYIERLVYRLKHPERKIRVATSDWLQQTMVMSQGAIRMSALELQEEVLRTKKEFEKRYMEQGVLHKNNLEHNIAPDILKELERMRRHNA